MSLDHTVSCILSVPRRLIEAAIRDMEERQLLNMMDRCCRAAPLRHVSLSGLAGMTKYAVVCALPLNCMHTWVSKEPCIPVNHPWASWPS